MTWTQYILETCQEASLVTGRDYLEFVQYILSTQALVKKGCAVASWPICSFWWIFKDILMYSKLQWLICEMVKAQMMNMRSLISRRIW